MAGRKKRNGGCGCGGMCGNPKCGPTRNPSLAARRNPVHTGSADYRIGLFQGAMEKGKLPPPHDTSADYRRGYADGAKVAKAKPTMVAEALGVYKATGDQQQAGAVLYNEVKGENMATLRNPSLNVRNPSGSKQRARGVRGYDDFSGAGDSAALAWAAQTRREMAAAKRGRYGDLDLYRRSHAADIEASSRHRPLRNPSFSPYAVGTVQSYKVGGNVYEFPSVWLQNYGWTPAKKAADLRDGDVQMYNYGYSAVISDVSHSGKKVNYHVTSNSGSDKGKVYSKSVNGSKLVPVTIESVVGKRNPSLNVRNPMSAAERKHCAHEHSEERAFASLLSKLPVGETVTLSGHRVRKLSKGYVVVDGERLTSSQAAAKIHRGK